MVQELGDALDEPALVDALKQGRPWAAATLVDRFQERLMRIAYGITLDHGEAQEIVQDAFLKALDNISGFRGEAGLFPWLRKITLNTGLNWRRKWKRRFRWHHQSIGQEADAPADLSTPETRLRHKQAEEQIHTAVRSLPESIRVVFVLNTLEGLSYAEIARALNLREGTVSSRLFRARQIILDRINNSE